MACHPFVVKAISVRVTFVLPHDPGTLILQGPFDQDCTWRVWNMDQLPCPHSAQWV